MRSTAISCQPTKPRESSRFRRCAKAAAHRLPTPYDRRMQRDCQMRMPTNPTARHLAVDEISQGLRHRLRANACARRPLQDATQSKRPLQHKQQTATHRIKSSGTLPRHQDPSTESTGLLAIQKVAKAAALARDVQLRASQCECQPTQPRDISRWTKRRPATSAPRQRRTHRPLQDAKPKQASAST